MAGVVVLEKQPCPQRSPLLMASLIAAVSSVTPSPDVWYQYRANGRPLRVRLTFAPKSLTLRNTLYPEGPRGAIPWCEMDSSQ